MTSNDLEVRSNLFKRGGVIGRYDYIKNILLMLLMATGVILLGQLLSEDAGRGTETAAVIAFPFFTYLGYINAFKRLRDIRGTTDKQLAYQIGLVVLMAFPYVSLVPFAFLVCTEGAVTGHGRFFQRLEDEVRCMRKQIHSH